MEYLQSKKLSKKTNKSGGPPPITEPQWRGMLEAAEASKEIFNKYWSRDYCAIYLGYMCALRLSECYKLERRHFENLEGHDLILIPASDKEVEIPVLEAAAAEYCLNYIESMRPDQRWLFESKPGHHISESYLTRIFNTYAHATGLDSSYSWQSLRHGRGYRLWAMTHNLAMVAKGMRLEISDAAKYTTLDPDAEKEFKKTLNKAAFSPLKHRKVGN